MQKIQREYWGEIEEESNALTPDNYVSTYAKKRKLDEIRQQGDPMPMDKHDKMELKSSLVTQTIEVMKQTEVLQSLIDTYSNTNGSSNYLLNPCQMIPEVDFPPENAADLVSEQKFQKPIWFIPTVDTAYSRGDPQSYPELSSNMCRHAMRKAMCGLLRLAGFTDCSEAAVILLTDAAESFLRSLIAKYRSFYDMDSKLKKMTTLQLVPLEQAYVSKTGTSLTQVHNYYKHKVIARNRTEIAEFDSVLQEYDKLMKESQSSMQKQQLEEQEQQQQHEFNRHEFLNILEMQQGDDNNSSSAAGSNSMSNIVGDMLQELQGGSTDAGGISLSNVANSQQQVLYGLLDGQTGNTSSNLATSSTNYQNNLDT
ncbi:uncharacterized protein LOC6557105 [Drosophila grimshawi]|nr:uncharacterized protein LOC6557105 [Drosophila grimshawi]